MSKKSLAEIAKGNGRDRYLYSFDLHGRRQIANSPMSNNGDVAHGGTSYYFSYGLAISYIRGNPKVALGLVVHRRLTVPVHAASYYPEHRFNIDVVPWIVVPVLNVAVVTDVCLPERGGAVPGVATNAFVELPDLNPSIDGLVVAVDPVKSG